MNFKFKIGQKLYRLESYNGNAEVEEIIIEKIKITEDVISFLSGSACEDCLVRQNHDGSKIIFSDFVFYDYKKAKRACKPFIEAEIISFKKRIKERKEDIKYYNKRIKELEAK